MAIQVNQMKIILCLQKVPINDQKKFRFIFSYVSPTKGKVFLT